MPVLVPHTLDDALAALAEHPDARLLAGGTDFMVEVNERHRPLNDPTTTVVALNRVPELRSWTIDRSQRSVSIGAGVTWAEIERAPLAEVVPALAEAARTVGSPQIRAAGTVGGNLGTCSPAGDGLPVLAALDALITLRSAEGLRQLPFAEFMVGVKSTALEPGEMIESITMPLLDGYQGYMKVGVRNAMVIATAGVCVAVDHSSHSVRIALGSVAPTIVRASAAEAVVNHHADWETSQLDPDDASEAGRLAAEASSPITDHRSTASYRRHAIATLTTRLLARAFPATGTVS